MPLTFGMADDVFRAWIQQPQIFAGTRGSEEIIPSEWNYYGDMSLNVAAPITGVQSDPAVRPSTETQSGLTALIGSRLTFSGNITDVNSEGSPPATQFFINSPTLMIGNTVLGGTPGKGACQWINFVRNVNMVADGGAGGYIYHVIRNGHRSLPGFDLAGVCGLVLRYYLFARHGGAEGNDAIARLYQQQKTNPAELQITGTIAPLYQTETVLTGPVGRLMISNQANVITPKADHNNLSDQKSTQPTGVPLAPAVLQVSGNRISIDAIASFPEQRSSSPAAPWGDPDLTNPKFDFGPVTLTISGADGQEARVGAIPYADTSAGNAIGWIFDFDISTNTAVKALLADPSARFAIEHDTFGRVLSETEYYVTTNAQAGYAEQHGATDQFRIQGKAAEPALFQVFHRGQPLATADTPPITLWSYRTTPLGSSGQRELLHKSYVPGSPISVPVDRSGTFLLTLSVGNEPPPPASYSDFIAPPFTTLTNRTGISLRILPNEDYSDFYIDPQSKNPIGNDKLTFDVVYQKVLRTYDLLFPAMKRFVDLSNEAAVRTNAGMILDRTDPARWSEPAYMPITRDLSSSRRELLQAWCRKSG